MAESSYLNFDLVLERVGEEFRARVFDSPAGQASTKFEIPFPELELENFILRMGRPRTGVRRVDSLEMEAAKKCGERLFRAVFADDVYACFLRSRDAALEAGRGLRIRLRIDVPEFHDFPWELLYNAHLNQFLALSKDTPVVRFMELPYPVQPLTVQPPLNILAMISSPEGFPSLDVEEEWHRLSNALAHLTHRGLVKLERLKSPTLTALLQQLRRGEYHVFHFIGHGKFSEHKQDGMLLLEDEGGKGRAVSGQYLGTVLHDHRSLRLVVLNACEGARTSREDPYAGVAQTLVLQGIPAVIAMQFEIAETAAITFAQEFYGAVADGFPVDAAVSEARKAIFATGNDVEWGTPVLYMRAPQGVIFELPEGQRSSLQAQAEATLYVDKDFEKELEQLYTEGLAAFWVEDWDKACDRFQRILNANPGHAPAAGKLAEAKRQRHLAGLYNRALEAQNTSNWRGAIEALEVLLKDSPAFRDAAGMLTNIRKQEQLAGLYAEARQLHGAMKWQAVAKVFSQIDSIDPNYPDAEELRLTAENKLEELKRETELNDLYSRALREMDAGRLEGAQQLFHQVKDTRPGYLETERLLSRLETRIRQAEEEQKRQYQCNMLYESARGLLRSGKWREAQDKLEEIRGLDERFGDPENLAEQARDGLEREEQQADRENELAARYAAAIQLVRSEKYREALEQWRGIRSMDSGYPDREMVEWTARKGLAALEESKREEQKTARQNELNARYDAAAESLRAGNFQEALDRWQEIIGADPSYPDRLLLERAARKGLDALTKPQTERPRFVAGRPFWFAMVGIAVLAIVILASLRGGQIFGDPALYDTFSKSGNQGAFDPAFWMDGDRNPKGEILQQEGFLTFIQSGRDLWTTLRASRYQDVLIDNPTFFEASLKIDPTVDGYVKIMAYLDVPDGNPMCGLHSSSDGVEAQCWTPRDSPSFAVEQGAWHVARIEVDTSANTIRYIIDGRLLAEEHYEPRLGGSHISLSIGVHAGAAREENSAPVRAYIDYVRIGSLR